MIFTIRVPIYRTRVVVLIDVSDEEAKKYYKRVGGTRLSDIELQTFEAVTVCDESGFALVRLQQNAPPSVVAHEFLHAVFFILSDRGLSLDNSSEEAYTYLLGYFIDQYHKRIKPSL